jgi:hypothetical protein
MGVFSRKKSVGGLNVRLMGLNVLVEHNILCLSREGTARWQSASRHFSQYFRPKNYLYINKIAKCSEKLADYTFERVGQEEKAQIARYCVCTRYPHYVPLTLNCVTLSRRLNLRQALSLAPATCPQSPATWPRRSRARVEIVFEDPISRLTRVSFDSLQIGIQYQLFIHSIIRSFRHDRRTL